MSVGLTSTEITVDLKRTTKAKWILFGDVHRGHNAHDEKAFAKLQDNILELAEEGVVIITGMGDLLDSIVPGDKRFSIAEHKDIFTVAQNSIVNWFKVLKKNKNIKLNGVLYGNHEYTLVRNGIMPFSSLQNEIGVEPYGVQTHNLIRFKVKGKEEVLRSVLGHQIGGKAYKSFLEFAREEKFQRRVDGAIVPVRILARGHNHELSAIPNCATIACPEEKRLYHFTQYLCETGSFLKQDYDTSSYATNAGYLKKMVGYVEIDIDFSRKEVVQVAPRFNGDLDAAGTLHIGGIV